MQEWRSHTCLPRATASVSPATSTERAVAYQWLCSTSAAKTAKKKTEPP